MIRQYLIPEEGDGESTQTAFRPKYLPDFGLNTSVTRLEGKGFFLCLVNTRFSDKLDLLEKLPGVFRLEDSPKAVSNLQKLLDQDLSKGDDLFTNVGKLGEKEFKKEDFSVSID